ncbi:hypothetical protein SXCC_00514 [Gluconacetobacter sp. SXCC-1]|nr:hypothetical protein SXCC_00514 [Gluconacetobacter sp. SXCC-1]
MYRSIISLLVAVEAASGVRFLNIVVALIPQRVPKQIAFASICRAATDGNQSKVFVEPAT